MNETPSTRIWVILAREASVGVIFRRGPSRHLQLIKWNLAGDSFEEGHWFKGRIYERRCHLSPDGAFLIYFAATYKEPLRSWTAISRPPYLTAMALWPKGDGWNGGGYFLGPMEIHLDHPVSESAPHPDFESGARRFQISSFANYRGEDDPVWCVTRDLRGWRMTHPGDWDGQQIKGYFATAEKPQTWVRTHPSLPLRLAMEIHAIHQVQGPWYVTKYRVLGEENKIFNDLGLTDWAEWEPGGDLLFAREGCLYRQRFADGMWLSAKILADFSGNKFRDFPSPAWATEFP